MSNIRKWKCLIDGKLARVPYAGDDIEAFLREVSTKSGRPVRQWSGEQGGPLPLQGSIDVELQKRGISPAGKFSFELGPPLQDYPTVPEVESLINGQQANPPRTGSPHGVAVVKPLVYPNVEDLEGKIKDEQAKLPPLSQTRVTRAQNQGTQPKVQGQGGEPKGQPDKLPRLSQTHVTPAQNQRAQPKVQGQGGEPKGQTDKLRNSPQTRVTTVQNSGANPPAQPNVQGQARVKDQRANPSVERIRNDQGKPVLKEDDTGHKGTEPETPVHGKQQEQDKKAPPQPAPPRVIDAKGRDQLTVVLLDDTGSMNEKFGEVDKSKLDIAIDMCERFQKRVKELQLFSVFCLEYVSSGTDVACEIGRDLPEVRKGSRARGSLCKRLDQLIEKLSEDTYSHLEKRIIVISDGSEGGRRTAEENMRSYWEICQKAIERKLLIDAIVIDGHEDSLLPALSRVSGGSAFSVMSEADASTVVDCDLVVDFACREQQRPIQYSFEKFKYVHDKLGFNKTELLRARSGLYEYPSDLTELDKCEKCFFQEKMQDLQKKNSLQVERIFRCRGDYEWCVLLKVDDKPSPVYYDIIVRYLDREHPVFIFPSLALSETNNFVDRRQRILVDGSKDLVEAIGEIHRQLLLLRGEDIRDHLAKVKNSFPNGVSAPYPQLEMFLCLHQGRKDKQ